jgi:hypothetical protein
MTKGVQLWPGDSMRAFYRRHIARETALDAAGTERLVEALTKATNRMLVWQMPGEAEPESQAAPAPAAAAKSADKKSAEAKPAKGEGASAKPAKADAATQPAAAAPVETEKPFDPYAFSAMSVLVKQGKDALAKRLADIKSVEHLKQLADAQHLGINRSLSKIEDVRKAVLTATEQRLADRRAAAS